MPPYRDEFRWIDQVPDCYSEDDDRADDDLGGMVRSEVWGDTGR